MNYNDIKDKLQDINIEDNIWVIYIIIICLSWYSNSLERQYFINNDMLAKEKYRQILILIFTILIFVYLYFFRSSMNDVNSLKITDNIKKVKLTELSAIASLLILISGLLFLYIAYQDNDIDVELAFN